MTTPIEKGHNLPEGFARARILVVSPTPALQRRLVFDRLHLKEVNRAREVEVLPSGKGLNCARAALRLGARAEVLTFTGGEAGEQFLRMAGEEGLRIRPVRAASPTRTCTTVMDQASGAVTELVENAGPVSPAEVGALMEIFAECLPACDVVVLTGTLPPGAKVTLYADLVRAAAEAGRKTVVDTQGEALLASLAQAPWLAKPNVGEALAATGTPCGGEEGVRLAVEHLHKGGAAHLLVTNGPRAALLSHGENGRIAIAPQKVAPANPIGSGDSVAAGLAVAAAAGCSLTVCARFGLLCGSANAAGAGYGRMDMQLLQSWLSDLPTWEA